MGARTNWAIRTEPSGDVIWLYGHWAGGSKRDRTDGALAAALPRANGGDFSYAARIFISQVIGNEWDSELSWGITTGDANDCPFEEEYDPVLVDFIAKQITYGPFTFSFNEYLTLKNELEHN